MRWFFAIALLAAIVALLLVGVLVLGGRSAWRLGARLLGPPPPPRQVDVALIADWMSVPYIGRAYRVPPPELYKALGIEAEGRQRRPLREIATETGRSTDETLRIVRETVQGWQDAHPEPTPPGAPSPPPMLPEVEKPGNGRPGGAEKPAGRRPSEGEIGFGERALAVTVVPKASTTLAPVTATALAPNDALAPEAPRYDART